MSSSARRRRRIPSPASLPDVRRVGHTPSARTASASRRTVASGVAQCGWSACVVSTRVNQFAKYPGSLSPPALVPVCEWAGTAPKTKITNVKNAFLQRRTWSPLSPRTLTESRNLKRKVATLIQIEPANQIVLIRINSHARRSENHRILMRVIPSAKECAR